MNSSGAPQRPVLMLNGASGGIGRAVAERFWAEGAALVLSDLDGDGLNAFAQTLDPTGEHVATATLDASDPGSSEALVALASERFGRIDYLVLAAGRYPARPIHEMSDAEWRDVVAVNLDSAFYLVRRALDTLTDGSAIVALTSMAAHRGSFYNAHYGASKGGLLSLTRSLARELAPKTRVNAVSPGIIETPMTTDLIRVRGEKSVEQTALGRFGQPSEVASVVHFLCSQDASFITGEVVHVNGGLYISG